MTPNIENICLKRCEDLVELQMPVTLPILKYLHLSGSKVSNLNLGLTPNLKVLKLMRCYYLQEIHAPVGCLKNLIHLKLSCLRFERFCYNPSVFLHRVNSLAILELMAESLDRCPLHPNNNLPKFKFQCIYCEVLPSLSGNLERLLSFGLCACTNLESFSAIICGLKHLTDLALEGSIPELPKDLWKLESLEQLAFVCMDKIKHLPDNICMLKHLKSLDLTSCNLLEQLPMDLGGLECLEELRLSQCRSLRDILDSICQLKCLKILDLFFCRLVEKLPEELGHVECLKLLSIEGAGISRLPESIFQLKDLRIIGSTWQQTQQPVS